MKLQTARDTYQEASGTASTIARQLALSGVAIIWLLSGGVINSRLHLTHQLAWASAYVLACLVIDVMQYLWRTAAWAVLAKVREVGLDREKARNPPPADAPTGAQREIGDTPWALNAVTWALFGAKFVALAVAYGYIYASVRHQISIT